MFGSKASKDGLNLLLGANAAGDSSLRNQCLFTILKILGALRIVKCTLHVRSVKMRLCAWANKVWMTAHLFTTCFTGI